MTEMNQQPDDDLMVTGDGSTKESVPAADLETPCELSTTYVEDEDANVKISDQQESDNVSNIENDMKGGFTATICEPEILLPQRHNLEDDLDCDMKVELQTDMVSSHDTNVDQVTVCDMSTVDSTVINPAVSVSSHEASKTDAAETNQAQALYERALAAEPCDEEEVSKNLCEQQFEVDTGDHESMEFNEWTIDYDFTDIKMILHESEEFKHFENNYLKGCKWSPDGSCLLTNSNDNKLRLFNLPNCLWNHDINVDRMELALTLPEGGLVYDFCWYPMMSSQNPDSCVLATTSRGLPVRLWDAFTGESRCVYKAYDHMDELISAKSIAFNNVGDKIYCGFEKAIRVFDTARPGRECQVFSYKSTKKHQVRGQSGIMSTIAFHPDDTMFAVGTYSKSIGLYSTETNKCVKILRGHMSGVTLVKFLPNGNHLLSGTRKDNEIFCWDIRYTRAPVYRCERLVRTNQRMQFDTDRSGRYLVSGNHTGKLIFWDLNGSPMEDSDLLAPVCVVDAHLDAVNGASFHPFLPLVGSASGQYHSQFSDQLLSDGDSDSDGEESSVEDNSLRLWWMGARNESDNAKKEDI